MVSHQENKNISFEEYQALKSKEAYSPEDKVIKEFNKRYAIVRTSTTYILVQKTDTTFELDSRKSFLCFHENDFFLTSDGKPKNKAIFWLKHPLRRTYESIIFDPTRPGNRDSSYNIFKGFAVSPLQGNCKMFWRHVREVICSSNEEHYLYVRKWMAAVVQKPALLATALVLRGLQGTGKNKFVDYFGRIFGPYFLTVTSLEHLCGKFNGHLRYAYLVHANEAVWTGSKKEAGAIKALITDPVIIVEGKGKDAIPVDNCRHFVISSNEDWAVPMDMDDRRFFVLDVSSHRKMDMRYFASLDEEMRTGGLEALLYDLLHEDILEFDPRKMPANDFGFDIKMQSAGSVEKYLYSALKEGYLDLGKDQPDIPWKSYACQKIYRHYRDWCKQESLMQETDAEFGKKLKKLLSIPKNRKSVQGRREWWYELLSLEESRAIFERFTRQTSRIWQE